MKTVTCPTTGKEIEVTICKPSRRKAHGSIQKSRYQKCFSGAHWIAIDKGDDNVER